jgi:hypothetical protein
VEKHATSLAYFSLQELVGLRPKEVNDQFTLTFTK